MLEIERKFLVVGQPWISAGEGVPIRQGYIARGQQAVVRVRVAGADALLTIKGPTKGVSRSEFEFPIEREQAENLFALCVGHIVCKTRYRIGIESHEFEIDVFEGENSGLVVAEIELGHENEHFSRPVWLGREVSFESRYRNSELSIRPYSAWVD